jgi:ribosome assembly protein YihI (activator of Der GTPase)
VDTDISHSAQALFDDLNNRVTAIEEHLGLADDTDETEDEDGEDTEDE